MGSRRLQLAGARWRTSRKSHRAIGPCAARTTPSTAGCVMEPPAPVPAGSLTCGYSPERAAALKRMLPRTIWPFGVGSGRRDFAATLHKWRAGDGKGQLLPDGRAEGWSSRKFGRCWKLRRKRRTWPAASAGVSGADHGLACGLRAGETGRASTARLGKATKEEKRRVKDLERELARKDRALAEDCSAAGCEKRHQRSGGTERTHDQHPRSPNRHCPDQ